VLGPYIIRDKLKSTRMKSSLYFVRFAFNLFLSQVLDSVLRVIVTHCLDFGVRYKFICPLHQCEKIFF